MLSEASELHTYQDQELDAKHLNFIKIQGVLHTYQGRSTSCEVKHPDFVQIRGVLHTYHSKPECLRLIHPSVLQDSKETTTVSCRRGGTALAVKVLHTASNAHQLAKGET